MDLGCCERKWGDVSTVGTGGQSAPFIQRMAVLDEKRKISLRWENLGRAGRGSPALPSQKLPVNLQMRFSDHLGMEAIDRFLFRRLSDASPKSGLADHCAGDRTH